MFGLLHISLGGVDILVKPLSGLGCLLSLPAVPFKFTFTILQLLEATFQLLLGPTTFLEVLWEEGAIRLTLMSGDPWEAPEKGSPTIFLSCFISCEYLASSRHTRTLRFSATSSRWPAKSFTSCRICTKDCCWLNLGWGGGGTGAAGQDPQEPHAPRPTSI